jgi:WD40 repeat protein
MNRDDGQAQCVAFDSLGGLLAVGLRLVSDAGRVILWKRDGQNGWTRACVLDNAHGVSPDHERVYRRDVESLAFSSTLGTLVSTTRKALNLWDVPRSILDGHGVLACMGERGEGLDSRYLAEGKGRIRLVAVNPRGNRIATAQEANGPDKVLVWDAATGAVLHRLRVANDNFAGLGFLSDGVLVVVLEKVPKIQCRGLLRAWDVESGAVVADRLLRARVVCAAVGAGAAAVCYAGGGLHVLPPGMSREVPWRHHRYGISGTVARRGHHPPPSPPHPTPHSLHTLPQPLPTTSHPPTNTPCLLRPAWRVRHHAPDAARARRGRERESLPPKSLSLPLPLSLSLSPPPPLSLPRAWRLHLRANATQLTADLDDC